MTVFRFAFAISSAAVLCIALAGCKDARRDTARAHLQTHPPDGFEVVSVPATIPVMNNPDGGSEAIVTVRYRLLAPMIEVRDGFALPRASEAARRLAAIRGWALGLPADDPARRSVLAAVADARAAFPVKRIVTPRGAEVDVPVSLTLSKSNAGWEVTGSKADINVPGAKDMDPGIPLEDSTEAAVRMDRLEAAAHQLEESRRQYLAARQRAADRSLATLRARLRTGQTFDGRLPDGTPIRIVVIRGLDTGGPVAAVLTVRGSEESSTRFTGSLAQQPSGDFVWRAAQVVTLSTPSSVSIPAATDANAHPILTLAPGGTGLEGQLEIGGASPVPLELRLGGAVDLIPEAAPQSTSNQ
ncbi:MAG: hypothetical protein PHC88_10430 [Terrimicrobiaceae bacterium]|nr:hypothetical protein [Terrimicrobiaceae bacterium]